MHFAEFQFSENFEKLESFEFCQNHKDALILTRNEIFSVNIYLDHTL